MARTRAWRTRESKPNQSTMIPSSATAVAASSNPASSLKSTGADEKRLPCDDPQPAVVEQELTQEVLSGEDFQGSYQEFSGTPSIPKEISQEHVEDVREELKDDAISCGAPEGPEQTLPGPTVTVPAIGEDIIEGVTVGEDLIEGVIVGDEVIEGVTAMAEEITTGPDGLMVGNLEEVTDASYMYETPTAEEVPVSDEQEDTGFNEEPTLGATIPQEGVTAGEHEQVTQLGLSNPPSAQVVAHRSPLFVNSNELDEDSARQLLNDSGWNVTQSVRKGGYRQWYYRTPPPKAALLGSLTSAVTMWKKLKDEQYKRDGGGDDDPYPTVTAFLNIQKATMKKRKRSRFSR